MPDGFLDGFSPFGMISSLVSGYMASEAQEDTNHSNQLIAQNNSAFNAEQANLAREFNAHEAATARDFSSDQAATSRGYNAAEAAKTRDWSSDEARINRAFQESQTTRQMDYQERLSNSAWQRAVKDMQAAGLNPMLAYRQGGASSPMGGAATGSMPSGATASSSPAQSFSASGPAASAAQTHPMQNSFAVGLSTASQAAQISKIQADTELTRAQADKTREETTTEPIRRLNIKADTEEKKERVRWLIEDGARIYTQAGLNTEQRALVEQQIKNAIEQNELIKADTRDTKANAVLKELQENEYINRSAHHVKYRDYNIDIQPFIGDATKAASSVADVVRSTRRYGR